MVDRMVHSYIKDTMREFDSMPAQWRQLIHEFGAEAEEMYQNRVPIDSRGAVMTAADARRALTR